MERWAAKVISLVLIFSISLVANLLPIKVAGHFTRQGARGVRVLSCLMCFGGGVFFATYMLHLAPEVNQIVHEAILEPYHINYPLSELIMVLGFFMILFLEHFVHALSTSTPHLPTHLPDGDTAAPGEKQSLGGAANGHVPIDVEAVSAAGEGEEVVVVVPPADPPPPRWTRSLLLLLALSLHHVFEGIGVGLQDSQGDVWSLCIAIISHEVVIAFSFGLQLVKTCSSRAKVVLSAVLCNAMTPLGIMAGTLLSEAGQEGSHAVDVANGVLQALSTGVFIYVTFFEILATELQQGHGSGGILRLLCALLGVAVLAVLVLIPEDTSTGAKDTQNST